MASMAMATRGTTSAATRTTTLAARATLLKMSLTSTATSSSINITDLIIHLPNGFGLSAFSLPNQPCQLLVTLTCHLLPHCLEPSSNIVQGVSDDWDTLGLGKSVNYSALSKSLTKRLGNAVEQEDVKSLEGLVQVAVQHVAEESPSSLDRIDVRIERKRALLFSENVEVYSSVKVGYPSPHLAPSSSPSSLPPTYTALETLTKTIRINNIQVDTIVGLNPHERLEKQRLEVDIEVDLLELVEDEREKSVTDSETGSNGLGFDYKTFGMVLQEVSPSSRHPPSHPVVAH
jgi:dihydroneopterin aldolase